MSSYVVLGIHGKGVDVGQELNSKGEAIDRNVARVRMYLNGQAIDEDFNLPRLPYTTLASLELYEDLLLPQIKARLDELAKDVLPENSKVVKIQPDRAVFTSEPSGKNINEVIKAAGIEVALAEIKNV